MTVTIKLAAVDSNKMTSLYRRPACGHVCWGSKSTASNDSAVVIGRKKSRGSEISQDMAFATSSVSK